MTQKKTWNTLSWTDRPERTRAISLICPFCGTDAELHIAETPSAKVIASIGLGVIFDPPSFLPPENFMPDELKCRTCRKIFSNKECADVR